MKKPLLLFILLQLVSYSYVICNTALSEPKKIYITKKIEGNPPEIDGLVNEAVWDNIEWSNGFKQTAPYEYIEPSQKTSFKILYDENNLYIAIKAFDSCPDSIEKRLTRRDEESGDKVGIGLDTYHDLRTAFIFIVNASGVKSDAIVTEDGGNWDYSWDPIWFVKTSINAEGWIAEIKIPLSQLRFGKQDIYLWGLNIGRTLFRKNEESLWQFISPKAAGWVSLFGELQGIKDIKPHKQKDIVPYIVTNFEKYEKEDGNPFAPGKEWHLNGGLDGKFGVTNDLTLDFTINPDFGQVEADPSEVNLTAFETRFEEKRPFFIEGRNILNFGLTPGDSPLSGDNIFYSRRIGRQPQYSPEYDDSYEFMDIPSYTTILGAFKLTGKTKDGWSVGVLESVTQNEKAVIKDTISGTTRHENSEPFTNYYLTRVQKDLNKGNTRIGGIISAMNRNLTEDIMNDFHKSAYSGGIDFNHQWKNKTYYFDFKFAVSQVNGTDTAILNTQTSYIRAFQRPDAKHLSVDSSKTSLTGTGGTIDIGRAGNGKVQYIFWLTWRSPGLELNDMGYSRQNDEIQQVFWLGYNQNEPFSIFRSANLNFNQWSGFNFGGERIYSGGNINAHCTFNNYYSIGGGINPNDTYLSQYELRGGPSLLYDRSIEGWYYIQTNNRKKLILYFNGYHNIDESRTNKYNSYYFGFTYRPTDYLNLSVYPSISHQLSNLAYVSNAEDSLENFKDFVRGNIDRKDANLVLRLNVYITPDFSVQYYAMPFLSKGKYDHFKYITDSKAKKFSDRYIEYSELQFLDNNDEDVYSIDKDIDGKEDYTFDNPDYKMFCFNSNLVLRWEYLPGSVLYVVWSQSKYNDEMTNGYTFMNALRESYQLTNNGERIISKPIWNQDYKVFPHNIFLVKLSYRFGL